MNKNQLKILEAKLDNQKAYIQELEGRINQASTQIRDNQTILSKTHEQIKRLNEELNELLSFILDLEEQKHLFNAQETLSLQEYMNITSIGEDKDLLFGLNIDEEFIQNRSIPTIKYFLYSIECFIQETHHLQNLKIFHKKDIDIIIGTLKDYIQLSFKNKGIEIRGLIQIDTPKNLFSDKPQMPILKFYGNQSIEEEVQGFIELYSQKD